MELKDYVKIIGQRFWLLFIVVVIVTLGVYLLTKTMPESYDGSVSVFITKKPDKGVVGDYEYDRYYAIKASSLLTDSIITWLQDPSNVIEIYNTTNLDLPTEKLNKLTKVIKAKKKDPATINITASAPDEVNVKNLINSTINFIDIRMNSDIVSGAAENFDLTYSDSIVLKHQKSPLLNSLIGFIVGVVLGLGMVFLVEYFYPKK